MCVRFWVIRPERDERSQRGPKGRKLEVGARRAPKLLVCNIGAYAHTCANICCWHIFPHPHGHPLSYSHNVIPSSDERSRESQLIWKDCSFTWRSWNVFEHFNEVKIYVSLNEHIEPNWQFQFKIYWVWTKSKSLKLVQMGGMKYSVVGACPFSPPQAGCQA